MIKKTAVALSMMFLCGCACVPFKRALYVRVDCLNAQKIPAQFSRELPERFELINSTVFAYRHMRFSCLGPIRVDTPNKSFTAIGMNQVGVKLFEFNFNDGSIESKYIFPELAGHGDFAEASCGDISKMYIDRIPPEDATVIPGKYKIIFRAPQKNGFLDYVFAGKDNLLIEKNMFTNGKKTWSVFYYEYIPKNGKIFPAGIILKNYAYKYCLTVRLKEILKVE